MLDDECQDCRLETRAVEAEGQVGGFGQVLLVERRSETCIRPVAVLHSRDAEFLAAAHNACLGMSLRELRELAGNGGAAALRYVPPPEETVRQAWAAGTAADRPPWPEYFMDEDPDGGFVGDGMQAAKLEATP